MAIAITRALDLLDQHLYGNLGAKAQAEALQGIDDVYRQLTYRENPITYYQGQQVKGIIEPDGAVAFKRSYPELGIESYYSPEELINFNNQGMYHHEDRFGNGWLTNPEGLAARNDVLSLLNNQPKPTKEMINMARQFNDYTITPEGARLYYNIPASEHRAKAYRKQGFEDIRIDDEFGSSTKQYLDKRPMIDNINPLYAFGDAINLGSDAAIVLHRQRLRNNGQSILPAPMDAIRKGLKNNEYYQSSGARYIPDDLPF